MEEPDGPDDEIRADHHQRHLELLDHYHGMEDDGEEVILFENEDEVSSLDGGFVIRDNSPSGKESLTPPRPSPVLGTLPENTTGRICSSWSSPTKGEIEMTLSFAVTAATEVSSSFTTTGSMEFGNGDSPMIKMIDVNKSPVFSDIEQPLFEENEEKGRSLTTEFLEVESTDSANTSRSDRDLLQPVMETMPVRSTNRAETSPKEPNKGGATSSESPLSRGIDLEPIDDSNDGGITTANIFEESKALMKARTNIDFTGQQELDGTLGASASVGTESLPLSTDACNSSPDENQDKLPALRQITEKELKTEEMEKKQDQGISSRIKQEPSQEAIETSQRAIVEVTTDTVSTHGPQEECSAVSSAEKVAISSSLSTGPSCMSYDGEEEYVDADNDADGTATVASASTTTTAATTKTSNRSDLGMDRATHERLLANILKEEDNEVEEDDDEDDEIVTMTEWKCRRQALLQSVKEDYQGCVQSSMRSKARYKAGFGKVTEHGRNIERTLSEKLEAQSDHLQLAKKEFADAQQALVDLDQQQATLEERFAIQKFNLELLKDFHQDKEFQIYFYDVVPTLMRLMDPNRTFGDIAWRAVDQNGIVTEIDDNITTDCEKASRTYLQFTKHRLEHIRYLYAASKKGRKSSDPKTIQQAEQMKQEAVGKYVTLNGILP